MMPKCKSLAVYIGIFVTIFCAALACFLPLATAQTAPTAEVVADEPSTAQLFATSVQLLEQAAKATEGRDSNIWEAELEANANKLKDLNEKLVGMLENESVVRVAELVEIEKQLIEARNSLEKTEAAFDQELQSYRSFESKLRKEQKFWKQLAADSEALSAAEVSQPQIQDVIRQTQAQIKAFNTLEKTYAQYKKKSIQLLDRGALVQERLVQARSRLHENLFEKLSPSMLSLNFWSKLSEVWSVEIIAGFSGLWRTLFHVAQEETKRVFLHLLLTVFIGWLLFHASKTELMERSFNALNDHPFLLTAASAIILSLFIYEDITPTFQSFIALIFVLPCALIIRSILGERFQHLIIGAASVFIIDQLQNILKASATIGQFLLLVELIIGLLVFLQASRMRVATGDVLSQRLIHYSIQLSRVISAIFFVLSGALFVGYYPLVVFVSDTVLGIAFTTLFFFVFYEVLKGALFSILFSGFFSSIRTLRLHRRETEFYLNRGLLFVLSLSWLLQIGTWLGVREQVGIWLENVLWNGFSVGTFEVTPAGLLGAVAIFYLGIWISRVVRLVLKEEMYTRRSFDQGLQYTIDTFAYYVIFVVTILAALSFLGLHFQNIAIIAGALSVGIGFGLQNIVNNFVSGIILLVERPIKINDLIDVAGTLGTVTRIGIRSSTIKTFDNAEIIIPNGELVTQSVTNLTLSNTIVRIRASVGVSYDTDVAVCMRVLREAGESLPSALKEPAVKVLFKSFGESALNFDVLVWVDDANQKGASESELNFAIFEALKKHGIAIPFPQRDVHIASRTASN